MMQTELLQKDLSKVGEAISHDLGLQMIKDYRLANPTEVTGTYIGREIIEKILAQPGCVGINFYHAVNEEGRKTLVYVGVDKSGRDLVKFSVVREDGKMRMENGIVADRGGNNPTPSDDNWLADILILLGI